MKLTLPEGFPLPENSRPGEPFDVVATIRPEKGGGFTLVALDGMEMEDDVPEQIDATNIRLPFEKDEEEDDD